MPPNRKAFHSPPKPVSVDTCRVGTSIPTDSELAANPLDLVSRKDLKAMGVNYSNPHLIALEREGRFPKRVMLSPARVAWLRCEIHAWVRERVARR